MKSQEELRKLIGMDKGKASRKINLQLFAEGGDGGDGSKSNEGGDGGDGGKGGDGGEGGKDDKGGKTFSQDDVNNISAKTKKETQEQIYRELGITDFGNAKEGYAKYKEWLESQKSEKQKSDEALKTAQDENATLKGNVSSLELKVEALMSGIDPKHVDDAIILAKARVTDDKTAADALKEVIEQNPHYVNGSEGGSGFVQTGAGSGGSGGKDRSGVEAAFFKLNKKLDK